MMRVRLLLVRSAFFTFFGFEVRLKEKDMAALEGDLLSRRVLVDGMYLPVGMIGLFEATRSRRTEREGGVFVRFAENSAVNPTK